MRVLLWSELYWPYIGGAEIFASKLMQSLRGRDVDFLVLTSHAEQTLPDEGEYEGIPIRRLPFRSAVAGRDVKSLARSLRETAAIKRAFAPDLIHVNAVGPSALFHLKTLDACEAPYIVTMQQEVLGSQTGAGGTLLAQTLASARWIVGCSDAVLDQLRAAAPSIAAKSSRIYNGLDVPDLLPAPLPQQRHVLCLGRLVPAKGFDVALQAFAQLAERYHDVRFTVAGDGAERDSLQLLARELRIADRVAFPGWIDPAGVPAAINDATMVVMPSRREGLPVVAVQASLMARPIVATPVGGLAEVVVDGESGVVTPVDDAASLAMAIERLLEDRESAAAMGRRGRERALGVLDWNATVAAYHELYTTICREGS